MTTATYEPQLDPGAQLATRAAVRLRVRARRFVNPDDPLDESAETMRAFDGAADDDRSPLDRLGEIFTLDRRERDYIEATLAVAVDPSLTRLLGAAAERAGLVYPTEPLLARLYEHGLHRVLTPESPLARWRLMRVESIGPGEAPVITLDPLVRDWLVGQRRLDEVLVGRARLVPPLPPLPRWPVDDIALWVHGVVSSGGRVRICLMGPPGSGRRTFAACVAERLGLPALALDTRETSDEEWRDVVLAAHRQAFLDGCALAWLADDASAPRWPDLPTMFPVQFVAAEVGVPAPLPGVVDRVVEMPSLEVAERVVVWRQHLPQASTWDEADIEALAAHHRLTPGDISGVGVRQPATAAEASALVRESSRHRLGELARWMECPFAWDDLIVPAPVRESLEDFVYEARHRATFWEQPSARRLFPQGQGLFALLTGNPGTGKTMAAQVVASTLGLDLFRISLAAVVSKYVGETAKNLHRTLARAEAIDAVLLFDEADALFGKRTDIKDAHDRFANTDTNYLLQAIEGYRGIAILATNKKANIDTAFTRRLRWVLEFPRPDAAQRQTMWFRLIEELAGAARVRALSPSLEALAANLEITGAQIKYAILAALFSARRDGRDLELQHLLRGVDRELMKEGQALTDHDRERCVNA
jgi:ATP-dependent 26S proteasome regulatory subunit